MQSVNYLLAGGAIGFGSVIRLLAIIENNDFDTKIKMPDALCTSGIYSIIRHPSYVGSLLILFGLSLYYTEDFELSLTITFLCFLYFLSRSMREERLLAGFENFKEYKNTVGGFIPYV